MNLQSGVTFVVSAFNEEANLAATLDTLKKSLSAFPEIAGEIIVVNDGSRDRTGQIADQAAAADPTIRVIHHPVNLGMGQSIRDGIQAATRERLFLIPGDNDIPESTIKKVLAHRNQAEMVMCYFLDREKRGRFRNLVSSLYSMIYTTVFDVYVVYLNAPCLYLTRYLREQKFRATRFAIVAEINIKLLRSGISFLEIASTLQTADEGSSAISWRNLREAMVMFLFIVYDVFWTEAPKYRSRPHRVLLP